MPFAIDTIDYVSKIESNATCAVALPIHFLSAKIDDDIINLGVVFN